ncbi:hypothetical protein KAR91_72675 [Candidatus Pacearchaeota archaeon]|nr:hypothetical protein [Candidatus Pacearchaeota archaeon]
MSVKLFYDNMADQATVSASDSVLNLPPSNVQDSRLSRIYRGDEQIDFDITGDGAPENIFEAFTNLVLDPTDLTLWSAGVNAVATDSGLTINGHQLSTVTNTGANSGYVPQSFTASFTNTILTGQVICRKGLSVGNVTIFRVRNITDPANIFNLSIDFDNFPNAPGIPAQGEIIDFTWYDEETILINFQCAALTDLTDDVEVRCYGSANATDAEYTYWTEVQLIDEAEITMFLFIDGIHSADVIDETQTLPDKLFIRITDFEPRFAYDTVSNHFVFTWRLDGTHFLRLNYQLSTNKWIIGYQDGGTSRTMVSQEFGSGFTDLNQKIDFYIFLNLVSGGINDSMFITLPKESGSINQNDSFSGVPDSKSSIFPTLSIGNESGVSQINSIYRGLQLGEWDGMKPTITSASDMDIYVEDKKIIFDTEYVDILTATDLLIANTTINAGDTITLRANDVDSFGPGSPVDETIDYDGSDILKHSFTKASYQYWRLSVNSSNVIDIGRLFLGERYDTPGIGFLIPHDRNSASKKTIAVAGQSYLDEKYFFSRSSARWPKLTEDENNQIIEIFEHVDIGKPFFITYENAGAILGTMYITIDAKALKSTPLGRRNLYTITLKFREEVK